MKPDNIELDISDDGDIDVEHSWLNDEEMVELDREEKEEDNIEEEMEDE